MKRFILIIILFTMQAVVMYGQSAESDKFFGKGVEAFKVGNYSEAIRFFEKADKLDEKELPKESCRNGYARAWMAHCYYKLGNEKKARELSYYDEFRIPPVDRRQTLESSKEDELALQCMSRNDYEGAIAHALKCMEIEEREVGTHSMSYLGSCLALANMYGYNRNLNEAAKYCTKGLDLLREMGFENSSLSSTFLYQRIRCKIGMEAFGQAENEMPQLYALVKAQDEAEGSTYLQGMAKVLEGLLELYRKVDYNKAGELFKEGYRMMSSSYKPEDEYVFNSMGEVPDYLYMAGRYEDIDTLLKETLSLPLTKDHRAKVMLQLGMYGLDANESVRFLDQCADLFKELGNSNMYYRARSYQADIMNSRGDMKEAFDVYQEICNHYESTGGASKSPEYRKALTSIGDIYLRMGDTANADKCYRKVIEFLSDDKDSIEYTMALLRWVPIAAGMSRYMEGQEGAELGAVIGNEFQRVLTTMDIAAFLHYGVGIQTLADTLLPIFRLILPNAMMIPGMSVQAIEAFLNQLVYDYLIPLMSENNYTTLQTMALLAHAKYILGNNGNAIELMKEIVDICKKNDWGADNFLSDLAYYQYENGDIDDAYQNFLIGFNLYKENILWGYRWMNLEERTKYTEATRGNLDNIPHYAALTPHDRRYAGLGYNALLFTKGLLLNSTIELTRLLQEEGDKETLKLLGKWRDINLQLQKEEKEGGPNVPALREKAGKLESQLLAKSKTYGDYTRNLAMNFEEVQKGLGAHDVAIEFFSYYKDARHRIYGALVLTASEPPRYVEVGCDADWKDVDMTRGCYETSEFFDMLFGNLKRYLPNKEKGSVYFAADGILHNIAVENMPGAERYNLKRLSSTRQIALGRKQGDEKAGKMALFGGISYGLGELASYYEPSESGSQGLAENKSGNASGGTTRASNSFLEYLPGTVTEVEDIQTVMSPKLKISKYMGREASKSKIGGLSHSRTDILHIATHGFFDENNGADPLVSSGLYFAGAQNTLWDMDADTNKDDGVLTSREISMLDLRGLKLAVLSACETGRGMISTDGVFGLQRGFKQAGTESVMMSLWKVDDIATQKLMSEFYINVKQGDNLYGALRKARAMVRSEYPDPHYWAAFVLIDADKQINM